MAHGVNVRTKTVYLPTCKLFTPSTCSSHTHLDAVFLTRRRNLIPNERKVTFGPCSSVLARVSPSLTSKQSTIALNSFAINLGSDFIIEVFTVKAKIESGSDDEPNSSLIQNSFLNQHRGLLGFEGKKVISVGGTQSKYSSWVGKFL